MSPSLDGLLDGFSSRTVLVIGDGMLDTYLEGVGGRICREAPVPIVTLTRRTDAPGGAANVAVNAARLGASVALVSVVGRDSEGSRLRRALHGAGVATRYLAVDPARGTLAKERVIGDGQLLVRFDHGSGNPVTGTVEDFIVAAIDRWYRIVDAVIVSDYGYGVITPRVLDLLRALQSTHATVVVVDAKSYSPYRDIGITVAKPNFDEAIRLLDLAPRPGSHHRGELIIDHSAELLDRTGSEMVVVTLDSEGAVVLERGRPPYRSYGWPARRARPAGAGDTFAAALGLALAAGGTGPPAVDLAAAAAAVVVSKEGTASCTREEIREIVSGRPKHLASSEALARCLATHRDARDRIVFTNGCFDILHRGHVSYLSRAKALGDVLIVAVNSDASVRRLKGERRPVNPLADRIEVLAALSCVDYVVAFEEDTPEALIQVVRPDVFAKGGDYTLEQLPEAPLVTALGGEVRILPFITDLTALGGEVRILPFITDRSTSSIIRRIRGPGTPPVAAA